MKPNLAAFPKCFMDQLCVDHTMTVFDWIELAATLGVDGLEFYSGFLRDDPACWPAQLTMDGLTYQALEPRPPARQRDYFEDYLSSLRETAPGRAEEQLRMLASRYVSPPEIAPHSAGAAIDLTLCK